MQLGVLPRTLVRSAVGVYHSPNRQGHSQCSYISMFPGKILFIYLFFCCVDPFILRSTLLFLWHSLSESLRHGPFTLFYSRFCLSRIHIRIIVINSSLGFLSLSLSLSLSFSPSVYIVHSSLQVVHDAFSASTELMYICLPVLMGSCAEVLRDLR